MTTLKATPGTQANEICHLLGYHYPGDGGGGDFYWDTLSVEANNDGTIIGVTNTSTGRWKRIFSGALHVKWFGAVGDGNTDDTAALQQCLNTAAAVYLDEGDYKITGKLTVSNKAIAISSSPAAFLNKKYLGDHLIHFNACPRVDLSVNLRNSLPAVLKFNDNGIWANIPQFRVEGLEASIFYLTQCGAVNIAHCDITAVYASAIFSFVDGFINFTGNYIHDNCFVDTCIQTWGHEAFYLERNKFLNIALMPDSFVIVKDGAELQQSFPSTSYAWQFGQAVGIIGNNFQAKDNHFENISGLSIGADHPAGPGLKKSMILISNNHFVADSDRLKGANPPGFVWVENHQSASVTENRFSYRKRAVGDGQFLLCRFAYARYNEEKPYFEYSRNTYIAADNITDSTGTIAVMTRSNDAVVNIENNKHYAPFSNFIYIDTISAERPCDHLTVQGNDVVCNEFVMGYNAEVFTGNNFFKLPREINIVNNPSVKCSGDFFSQRGEYGDTDLKLNIIGNNIVAAQRIYLLNGSFEATIARNTAPHTAITWDWAVTATRESKIRVMENTALGKVDLISGTQFSLQFIDNLVNEEVNFKNLLIAVDIRGNTFQSGVSLRGNVNNAHVVSNIFKNRLLLINVELYKTDITYNVFEGNGLGIYGYDPSSTSLKLNYANFIGNAFITDLIFNAIEFPDFVQYTGLNYITNNTTTNRNNLPPMPVCNRRGNPNLVISPAAGPTADRPTGQPTGLEYLDTTLQKKITWWGTTWKDAAGNNV